MKSEITAMNNQSWLDISMQFLGGIKNAQKLAHFNRASLTDEITPGQKVIVPKTLVEDVEIVEYFKVKSIQPATAIQGAEVVLDTIPFLVVNQSIIQ